MSTTPEGRVKRDIKTELSDHDVWYYMPVQMGMGVVGIPDFICCQPVVVTQDMVGKKIGLFLAIEAKAPGKINNTTANQNARIREIREAGGVAFAADDALIVKEYLDGNVKKGSGNEEGV